MERETEIGRANIQESAFPPTKDRFQNTIAFIERALAEGAHFKVPKRYTQERWERNLDIALVYLLNPDYNLEEIGKIFGITGERVRQIKEKTMRIIRLNCSKETQTVFPINELELNKPLTQRISERRSQVKGGLSIIVNTGLQAGKPLRVIQHENSLSTQQIANSRKTLRRRGITVPTYETTPSENLELESKLRNAKTYQEKQEGLNQVKRRFYHTHVKADDALLVSLSIVMKESGFGISKFNNVFSLFQQALKNKDNPVAMGKLQYKFTKDGKDIVHRYSFILSQDKERAKEILRADPNLQRFIRS